MSEHSCMTVGSTISPSDGVDGRYLPGADWWADVIDRLVARLPASWRASSTSPCWLAGARPGASRRSDAPLASSIESLSQLCNTASNTCRHQSTGQLGDVCYEREPSILIHMAVPLPPWQRNRLTAEVSRWFQWWISCFSFLHTALRTAKSHSN